MDWFAIALAAWVSISALVAVVVGRAIHLADQQSDVRGGGDRRVVDIRTTTARRAGRPSAP